MDIFPYCATLIWPDSCLFLVRLIVLCSRDAELGCAAEMATVVQDVAAFLLEVPAPAVTFPWITTGAFKAELKSSWLVPCWNRWIPVPSVLLTGQKAGNSWRAEASLLISLRPCVEGSKALHPVCLELEDPEHSPTPKERKFPINSFSKKTLLPHLFDHVLLDFFVLLLSSLVFVAPLNSISSFQINFFILRRIFKFYL